MWKFVKKYHTRRIIAEEPFSQQINTYYAACGMYGKINIWEKSSSHPSKSIAAVAPQGLRSPLKCSSNDSTQSARSSIKNEANGRVMRTMCTRVKKLKIHRGKIDEGCILLLKLYMAWNVVLFMTPLYDKGKEKNFVLKRSRNGEKIMSFVCGWKIEVK